jgi:hypothetical protein
MDAQDCVNLFISEGAGVSEIVAAMEAAGEEVPRDAFGHVHLDKINPGQWFAKQFAAELGADKVLVQKSGYFSRSAAANAADLALIRQCTNYAVDAALRGESGVVGQDEEGGTSSGSSSSNGLRAARSSIHPSPGSPNCCTSWAKLDHHGGLTRQAIHPVGCGLKFVGRNAGLFGVDGNLAQSDQFPCADGFVELQAAPPGNRPDHRPERVDITAPQDDVLADRGQTCAFKAGTRLRNIEKADAPMATERIDGRSQDDVRARVGTPPTMFGIVGTRRLASIQLSGRHPNSIGLFA